MSASFGDDWLRRMGVAKGGISGFSIDLRRRSTNAFIMPRPTGISDDARLTSDVCLKSVAYTGPKSRTERPRKTRIVTEVAHVTRDFQGQKVKVRDGSIVWRPNYRPHSILQTRSWSYIKMHIYVTSKPTTKMLQKLSMVLH